MRWRCTHRRKHRVTRKLSLLMCWASLAIASQCAQSAWVAPLVEKRLGTSNCHTYFVVIALQGGCFFDCGGCSSPCIWTPGSRSDGAGRGHAHVRCGDVATVELVQCITYQAGAIRFWRGTKLGSCAMGALWHAICSCSTMVAALWTCQGPSSRSRCCSSHHRCHCM